SLDTLSFSLQDVARVSNRLSVVIEQHEPELALGLLDLEAVHRPGLRRDRLRLELRDHDLVARVKDVRVRTLLPQFGVIGVLVERFAAEAVRLRNGGNGLALLDDVGWHLVTRPSLNPCRHSRAPWAPLPQATS